MRKQICRPDNLAVAEGLAQARLVGGGSVGKGEGLSQALMTSCLAVESLGDGVVWGHSPSGAVTAVALRGSRLARWWRKDPGSDSSFHRSSPYGVNQWRGWEGGQCRS